MNTSGIIIFENGEIVNFGQIASSKKMIAAMQRAIGQFADQEKAIAIDLLTPEELERALTAALTRQYELDNKPGDDKS